MTHDRADEPSTAAEAATEAPGATGAPPPPRPPQTEPAGGEASASPPDDDRDARLWATLAHLSGFLGFLFPLSNIVAPLVLWLLQRERWPLVDDQGKEALNFQISVTIYMIVAGLLSLVVIGIPILVALVIFDFVVIIIASIKANEGTYYRYPLTIRFVQ